MMFTAAALWAPVVMMSRSLYIFLYKFFVCVVTSIQPLIGPKWECHIIEEIIEVDELDKGKNLLHQEH